MHLSFAIVAFLIVFAGGTGGVVDNGGGLETIGEDDVGVHCSDVNVVDVGCFHAARSVTEKLQLFNNFSSDL